tara:strand:- start:1464 stop:1631 length:168 start_codon:yes stop_codon:yes gene_type:complete
MSPARTFNFKIVKFIKQNLVLFLDGHNILVTPVPIPNTEVKLDVFMSVLPLGGKT